LDVAESHPEELILRDGAARYRARARQFPIPAPHGFDHGLGQSRSPESLLRVRGQVEARAALLGVGDENRFVDAGFGHLHEILNGGAHRIFLASEARGRDEAEKRYRKSQFASHRRNLLTDPHHRSWEARSRALS
jgi:hypothetical protein